MIWKIQNVGKGFLSINSGLKGRDQELWEDFLSLGIGTKFEKSFKKTVNHYSEQRHNKIKNSIEAKLFKLVCEKIDNNFELKFTGFWSYLTCDNPEISGKLSEHGPSTFFADDYPEKITPQFLAKLFEYKFQATKENIKKRIDGRMHQKTIYRFKKDVMQRLVQKYQTEISIDHVLYVGKLGEQGNNTNDENDNKVNQVHRHTKAGVST